jgi:hypothetical protein
MSTAKMFVIVGLGISAIFLGIRVGGDIGHYLLQQFGQTPNTTALS